MPTLATPPHTHTHTLTAARLRRQRARPAPLYRHDCALPVRGRDCRDHARRGDNAAGRARAPRVGRSARRRTRVAHVARPPRAAAARARRNVAGANRFFLPLCFLVLGILVSVATVHTSALDRISNIVLCTAFYSVVSICVAPNGNTAHCLEFLSARADLELAARLTRAVFRRVEMDCIVARFRRLGPNACFRRPAECECDYIQPISRHHQRHHQQRK